MNVACASDISLGYGSPQIISLVRSLHEYVGGSSRPLLLEVDQPDRPPRHDRFGDLEFIRVETSLHPHRFALSKIEYVQTCARLLNQRRPDVLVIPNTMCLPLLWKLRYRPRLVIYYVLETPCSFGFDSEEHDLNLAARDRIDLAIYPERNRARIHLDAFGYHHIPNVVLFNVSPVEPDPPLPASARNRRILYQGTIHELRTGGNYYLDPRVQAMPIDLYGNLDGCSDVFRQRLTAGLKEARYRGYVDNATLHQIRRRYAYSIVYWNPESENQRYACPNKFFESIADGVPPIAAPHPQTKMLVERHRCGIVMDDWSLDAFVRALEHALELFQTDEYERMATNCRLAHEQELNWEAQFAKLRWQLDRMGLAPHRAVRAGHQPSDSQEQRRAGVPSSTTSPAPPPEPAPSPPGALVLSPHARESGHASPRSRRGRRADASPATQR